MEISLQRVWAEIWDAQLEMGAADFALTVDGNCLWRKENDDILLPFMLGAIQRLLNILSSQSAHSYYLFPS